MSEQHFLKEENLLIIKEIEFQPTVTQRKLSKKVGVSLGKVNYLLKELIKKGLVEVRNFSDKPGKFNKLQYHLTKEGMEHKIQITQHFLKMKEAEYCRIKAEWESIVANGNTVNSIKSADKTMVGL
jgi:EPS-associated MarR family transcriptional regulator